MEELCFYKIRNKKSELFSTGGQSPKWNKNGKVWKTIGHLKAHLGQDVFRRNSFYEEAEVVKYSVVETDCEDISFLFVKISNDKQKQLESQAIYIANLIKQEEIEELNRLKEKYPEYS